MPFPGRRSAIYEVLEADQQRRSEALERAKPITIDVPFVQVGAEPEEPRCSEVHTDGRQCELPAAGPRGKCARHVRWGDIYPTSLPCPDDALGLQEMLGYAVVCTIDKMITPEQAHAIAELGRVMEKNLGGCQRQMEEIKRRR